MQFQMSRSPTLRKAFLAGSADGVMDVPGATVQRKTVIARRINPKKLRRFLDTRFGNSYHVVLQQDRYIVTARRKLSTVEINSCL
ncbi:hypothetical protein FJTKL_03557 [Diaporthe vaccinii]|uniref:Uncharacterized protein n=1 Tax=Diaporthe vaccinii TaxID=105482 RepID=A0ABR4DVZ3_9PEZI